MKKEKSHVGCCVIDDKKIDQTRSEYDKNDTKRKKNLSHLFFFVMIILTLAHTKLKLMKNCVKQNWKIGWFRLR